MNIKAIKSTLLAAIVTAVLCAGTVSARQLRSDAKGLTTCGGSCGANKPCKSGCICAFPLESTTGFARRIPREYIRRQNSRNVILAIQVLKNERKNHEKDSRTYSYSDDCHCSLRGNGFRPPVVLNVQDTTCQHHFCTKTNPAPTFWAADASSTTPAPPQAYAGSLQPGRHSSPDRIHFLRSVIERKSES